MSEDQQRTPSPTPQSSTTDNLPQNRITRVRAVIPGRRCEFSDNLLPEDLLILVGGIHGPWMDDYTTSEGCLLKATENLLHQTTLTLLDRWARPTNDELPDKLIFDSGIVRKSLLEKANGEDVMDWPKIHPKEDCAQAAITRALELLRLHPETQKNYSKEQMDVDHD